VDAVMPETEEGFNPDIVLKGLLDLLVRKRVLKQKEVDQLLESAKTHFDEAPEEHDINDLV
jgi:hypothetical protein